MSVFSIVKFGKTYLVSYVSSMVLEHFKFFLISVINLKYSWKHSLVKLL